MTFLFPYFKPETKEEIFAAEILNNLEYHKINHQSKYLGYTGVGDFLVQLSQELHNIHSLNSKEMLKKSYPYRLKEFKDYKNANPIFLGPLVRLSRISFFEERLFDCLIEEWITKSFQSIENSINVQKSRIKMFECFNRYLVSNGYCYSIKIIEIAEYELQKRIQRDVIQVNTTNGSESKPLDQIQIKRIFKIANELVNLKFIEDQLSFNQVFQIHSDIIQDECLVQWNAHLSDLCFLMVFIQESNLCCIEENSQLVEIIELKFRNKKGNTFHKPRIIEALSRARRESSEYSDKVPNSKSKAPILYKIVQDSL